MHLAVATHLRATFADDGAEVAEVVAQHYRDAYEAMPDDADAADVRDQARAAFVRAGRRALSVGAPEPALRAFTLAAELAVDEAERAGLLAEAGGAALECSRAAEAEPLLETAIAAHRRAGRDHEAALLTESLAMAVAHQSQGERAIALLQPALAEVSQGEPDEALARLHSRLGHLLFFAGRPEEAALHVEAALELAQALELPAVLAGAGMIKGLYLDAHERHEEAFAILEWAAEVADRHGLLREGATAHGNAADHAISADDLPGATEHLDAVLALARRRGSPSMEGFAVYNRAVVDLQRGEWAAVEASATEFAQRYEQRPELQSFSHGVLVQLYGRRGDVAAARESLAALTHFETSDDVQDRALHAMFAAVVAAADRDYAEMLRLARESVLSMVPTMGGRHECVRTAWPEGMEAALMLGDLAAAEALMAVVADRPVGHVPPFLRAQLVRFRARLAAAKGEHDGVAADFELAERMLTDLGYPYALACVQRDHAAWLIDGDRSGEAVLLLRAAEATFEGLGAKPALGRVRDLLGSVPAAATV